jgi:alkanesulfonate monooxygenase SsuD/methylene tetrahydromethanopterin reductase-like flavin-dependent oxidoreductase (luciferase family)
LKYAVNLPIFERYSDARYLAELARDAEDAGWDGFFIWDHMATPWGDQIGDPWISLAAIAMNTSRVKLGPMVTPLPRRRPHKVAKESVALDRLSGGRLVMGVGLGTTWHEEYDCVGEEFDYKVRARMLDEGLQVLTGLWGSGYDQPFSFEGQHYKVQGARFTPNPVQEPRIPIWVAGTWPLKGPLARAMQWDGYFPMMLNEQGEIAEMTPQHIREVSTYIKDHRDSDTPFDIVLGGETPGDDPARGAEIAAEYEEAGLTWWHEAIVPTRWGAWPYPWPIEQMRERIVQGPPVLKRET